MPNGHVCCLLGVCCPNASDQENALSEEMTHDLKLESIDSAKVAKWIITHFDLAPAGTLAPYRDAIVGHARKLKPEADA